MSWTFMFSSCGFQAIRLTGKSQKTEQPRQVRWASAHLLKIILLKRLVALPGWAVAFPCYTRDLESGSSWVDVIARNCVNAPPRRSTRAHQGHKSALECTGSLNKIHSAHSCQKEGKIETRR